MCSLKYMYVKKKKKKKKVLLFIIKNMDYSYTPSWLHSCYGDIPGVILKNML